MRQNLERFGFMPSNFYVISWSLNWPSICQKKCTLGIQFFTSVDASMVFMQERHSKGGGIHDNTTLTTKLLPIHCIIFRSSKETVYFREISERSLPQLHTVVSRFSGLCLSPPKGSLNHYSSLKRIISMIWFDQPRKKNSALNYKKSTESESTKSITSWEYPLTYIWSRSGSRSRCIIQIKSKH